MDGSITRYKPSDEIKYEGEKILEIRDPIPIAKEDTDATVIADVGDNLKIIANEVYGDARLYWIIAEYNDIIDPFASIEAGTELRYPSIKTVREFIL